MRHLLKAPKWACPRAFLRLLAESAKLLIILFSRPRRMAKVARGGRAGEKKGERDSKQASERKPRRAP